MSENVNVAPSVDAQTFMQEMSGLCAKYARRVSPAEMSVAMAYMTGWSLAGVSAHEKLQPALHENIEAGRKFAQGAMTAAKIHGAVRRAQQK